MRKLRIIEYDLPNGLHVILNPDKTAPVVAVDVWYHVGSKNEEPNRTGFAHLFEHMMFQGSEHVGKAEHMRYIEQAGGTFNGSTTWDRTNYFETVPPDHLELALWLESDRMASLDVSPENLDNQREVVKEERRWRVDNKPYGTAWEKIFSNAFSIHPYHWPVVGYMPDLEAATVNEVRSFFRKFYAPGNAVLVVAGDFDVTRARRAVEKYFATIPAGEKIDGRFVEEPPLRKPMRVIVSDHVALPAVYLAFRIPPMTSPDLEPLNLAAEILAGGKSSRLYSELVYKGGIAQSVEAFPVETEHPGIFVISSVVSPGHTPEEVEERIMEQVGILAAIPPSGRETEKARNRIASQWSRQLSRAVGRADNLAHYHTFYGSASAIDDVIPKHLAVTTESISEVTRRYLTAEERVVVDYVPAEGGRSPDRKVEVNAAKYDVHY